MGVALLEVAYFAIWRRRTTQGTVFPKFADFSVGSCPVGTSVCTNLPASYRLITRKSRGGK